MCLLAVGSEERAKSSELLIAWNKFIRCVSPAWNGNSILVLWTQNNKLTWKPSEAETVSGTNVKWDNRWDILNEHLLRRRFRVRKLRRAMFTLYRFTLNFVWFAFWLNFFYSCHLLLKITTSFFVKWVCPGFALPITARSISFFSAAVITKKHLSLCVTRMEYQVDADKWRLKLFCISFVLTLIKL